MKELVRIGVYICHCGGNISDTVDVDTVRKEIAKLEGVKVSQTHEYTCSDPGQEMIQKGIREHRLNRIVVASCSPRMHLDTFRRMAQECGLNPYLLEMANIREQCSWVHGDKEAATSKAINIVRGAVERARHLEPLQSKSVQVTRNVIIVGGGIAGITAAIELADKVDQVYVVEKRPSIGGHMAQLSKTFPTLDCSQCILTPEMVRVSQYSNVQLITMAELEAVEGSAGNFRVLIRKKPRYVDSSKCVACGECEKVCPIKVPSEFDVGLSMRKAIYTPFKQAIPRTYVIDREHCIFLNKGVCRLCERFCKGRAIDFKQKDETIKLDVGAIVCCTGFDQMDPGKFEEYSFAMHPDIITNLQLERLLGQEMRRPSNQEPARKVAFVLCVGSRMMNREQGVEHCCKIGCMAAIKQALLIQKIIPDAESWIFYTDIRADGKGYEEFYMRAQNRNVRFVRGRVSEVLPLDNGGILVRAEDTLSGNPIEERFDLVVLVAGIVPTFGSQELAQRIGTQVGSDGFFLEKHYKLRPVESQREGVFAAGCSLGPKDVRETTLEALAVASRVATFLGKGEIYVSPETAHISSEKCNACEICIKACPVGAAQKSSAGVTINSVSCVGCGICVPKCPNEAIDLHNYTEEQLISQIKGITEEGLSPKIIAFLEKDIAYGSADLAGQTRVSYPPSVKIIRVPTTGRIGLKHLLHAFASGADGIIFLEGHGGVFSEEVLRKHVDQLKRDLSTYGVESLRLVSFSTTIPEYNKVINLFETFSTRIAKMGPLRQEVGENIKEKVKPS